MQVLVTLLPHHLTVAKLGSWTRISSPGSVIMSSRVGRMRWMAMQVELTWPRPPPPIRQIRFCP